MANLKTKLKSLIGNSSQLAGHLGVSKLLSHKINYIVERKDWAIRWDGIQICENVNKRRSNIAKVTTLPLLKDNSIVHFGSQFLWQEWHQFSRFHNKIVVSFFHGKYGDDGHMDEHIDFFLCHINEIDSIVVPNTLVHNRLKAWGVDNEKIKKIPLGVDMRRFTPTTLAEKKRLKEKWKIPDQSLVIGSFQKDGQGWGEGNIAKLIKGPDLFVEIVEKIATNFDITVLLTGPARGYVKQELEKRNIRYRHTYFTDYLQIVQAYNLLDCYLMTSREEGGPKSILESAACNVPVIASNIGMAPDIFTGPYKNFLFSPDTPHEAVDIFSKMFNEGTNNFIPELNFRDLVQNYDWKIISARYWEKVYEPLMQELE